jgi:hypothetical protein
MYWSWLKHRFIILEGVTDTLGNNFNGGTIGLAYHVGTDTCYRTVTLTGLNITVDKNATKNINLNLDILKIFKGSSDALDMFQQPGTQSESSDLVVALKFADQFSKAFSYSE